MSLLSGVLGTSMAIFLEIFIQFVLHQKIFTLSFYDNMDYLTIFSVILGEGGIRSRGSCHSDRVLITPGIYPAY